MNVHYKTRAIIKVIAAKSLQELPPLKGMQTIFARIHLRQEEEEQFIVSVKLSEAKN